jgi:hypothetical protein
MSEYRGIGVVPTREFIPRGKTAPMTEDDLPPRLIYSPPGTIIESVEVVAIYWGATWDSGADAILSGDLDTFFNYIVTSPLMDMLSEYNSPNTQIKHGKLKKSVRITTSEPGTPDPTGPGRTITDTEVQQALLNFIANPTFPQPDANTLYFIYLPPNVTCTTGGLTSCVAGVGGMCGYHSSDTSGPNPARRYAVIPHFRSCLNCLIGGSLFDTYTIVTSHELCEAITDPDGITWNDPTVKFGEIGDLCNRIPINLGSYLVQAEWSNSRSRCLVSPFRFSPGITINGVDSTPEPLAACEFKQKLILFWKANDASNSIYFSPSSNGQDWPNGQKINAVDSTPKALTACAYLDKVYLFWKANDSSNAIYFSTYDGVTWAIGQKINNVDSTPEPLAACVYHNLLYLFWKANDSSNAIYFSTYDGVTWANGQKINNVDSTPEAPAACVFGDLLCVFWKANDSSNAIYFSVYEGVTWSTGRKINNVDNTGAFPAACSFNDPFVFWKANDSSDSIFMSASPDTFSWPAGIKVNDVDYTPCAPACCVFASDQLYLFWKADDASNSIYFSKLLNPPLVV